MSKFYSSLKVILHSKRANIYYLERCRVLQKDGRVLYLTEGKDEQLYYNIPIANTTCIILGIGTSITQAAVRMLASAGVLIGFSGSGGTPLLMANDVEWLTPQSEYRPTEYVQGWLSWWFDDEKRLKIAKQLQLARLDFLQKVWQKDKNFRSYGLDPKSEQITHLIASQRQQIVMQKDVTDLLALEGRVTKELYHAIGSNTQHSDFVRDHTATDKINQFLNYGNYLAYGLGATTAWVLGIPHSFAVMHGKTRRGALVFDIADLVKDAIVLPLAFICAKEKSTEQEFRQEILNCFTDHKALDFMFETVKELALKRDF